MLRVLQIARFEIRRSRMNLAEHCAETQAAIPLIKHFRLSDRSRMNACARDSCNVRKIAAGSELLD